jgi:diguanylate cyclase (GGDEF)-like protein
MHGIARSELQGMLEQLDHAIRGHQEWYEALARSFICRLPIDPAGMAADAHRRCTFGRWYYSQTSERLRNHPAFAAMERQHQEMHDLASKLMREAAGGGAVAAADYDHFTQRMAAFRLDLETLRSELEIALGNLDPLTGANNRIGMLSWLRAQHELVRRDVLSCSLAMIDLDHFKRINDRYGHQVGDAVLATVSHYVLDHIRPYDKLYRYGGEEFLLCMQGVDADASLGLVDRLRMGLATTPIAVDHGEVLCHFSCGVAQLEADVSVEKAIEHADKAMYAAKSRGRNCTQRWESAALRDG